MTLVLNKSYGRYSAGTEVTLVTQPGKTRDEVTVEATYTKRYTSRDILLRVTEHFDRVTEIFEVPTEYLTELRNRTDYVPVKNRKVRRAEKRIAANVISGLRNRNATLDFKGNPVND